MIRRILVWHVILTESRPLPAAPNLDPKGGEEDLNSTRRHLLCVDRPCMVAILFFRCGLCSWFCAAVVFAVMSLARSAAVSILYKLSPKRNGDEEKSSEEESSLEDLEDSSSSESSLDPEEDGELEEEAARYEEERYGHRRLRSSGAMAAPCSPSAPPPYLGVGRNHFIKGKIWSRLAAAFPVFENSVTQERVYEPVSYKQLKDLMEAVKTYGVTATYTTALLRRLTVNAMTPTDWYEVARTCLNHGQFLDFRSIVLDKAQAQYRKNVQDGRPDWTVDMLLGQGLHAVDQTNYPFEVYRQVNEIFYQSWRAIPNKGEITGNLTKIIQAAAEPFSDYVARMLDTAERGGDEPEAQDDGCLDPDGDPDATMAQQTMPHGEDGTLGGDQSLTDADANSC
ncbi:hypothetical protein STEG23_002803 [Scotinomys teguina]